MLTYILSSESQLLSQIRARLEDNKGLRIVTTCSSTGADLIINNSKQKTSFQFFVLTSACLLNDHNRSVFTQRCVAVSKRCKHWFVAFHSSFDFVVKEMANFFGACAHMLVHGPVLLVTSNTEDLAQKLLFVGRVSLEDEIQLRDEFFENFKKDLFGKDKVLQLFEDGETDRRETTLLLRYFGTLHNLSIQKTQDLLKSPVSKKLIEKLKHFFRIDS